MFWVSLNVLFVVHVSCIRGSPVYVPKVEDEPKWEDEPSNGWENWTPWTPRPWDNWTPWTPDPWDWKPETPDPWENWTPWTPPWTLRPWDNWTPWTPDPWDWKPKTPYPWENWTPWTPFPWDRFTVPTFDFTVSPPDYDNGTVQLTVYAILFLIAIVCAILKYACSTICKSVADDTIGPSSSRSAATGLRRPMATRSQFHRDSQGMRNVLLSSGSGSSTDSVGVVPTLGIPIPGERPVPPSDRPPEYSAVVTGYMLGDDPFPEVHKSVPETPPPPYDSNAPPYSPPRY